MDENVVVFDENSCKLRLKKSEDENTDDEILDNLKCPPKAKRTSVGVYFHLPFQHL